MDTKQKFALPVKRLASVLFAVFIVATLLWLLPGLLAGTLNLPGVSSTVSAAGDPRDRCGRRYRL